MTDAGAENVHVEIYLRGGLQFEIRVGHSDGRLWCGWTCVKCGMWRAWTMQGDTETAVSIAQASASDHLQKHLSTVPASFPVESDALDSAMSSAGQADPQKSSKPTS